MISSIGLVDKDIIHTQIKMDTFTADTIDAENRQFSVISDERIFANTDKIKEVLSTNALIAALFLTLEFPLLALDTVGY